MTQFSLWSDGQFIGVTEAPNAATAWQRCERQADRGISRFPSHLVDDAGTVHERPNLSGIVGPILRWSPADAQDAADHRGWGTTDYLAPTANVPLDEHRTARAGRIAQDRADRLNALVNRQAARAAARHRGTFPDVYAGHVAECLCGPCLTAWYTRFRRSAGSIPRNLTGALVAPTIRGRGQSLDIFDEYRLRGDADALLAAACECERDDAGHVVTRCEPCQLIGTEPDIYVNGHVETRPDRVAFRGTIRTRVKPRHRSFPRRDYVSGDIPAPVGFDDTQYVWQLDWQPVRITCLATLVDHRRLLIGAPGMIGSRGHRRDHEVRAEARRKARAGRKARGVKSRRGPARTPWTLSARSLPRVWADATADQHALAARWVDLFVTSTDDTPVTIGPLTITRDGAARVIPAGHTAMTMQEAARRAALAGMVPD